MIDLLKDEEEDRDASSSSLLQQAMVTPRGGIGTNRGPEEDLDMMNCSALKKASQNAPPLLPLSISPRKVLL